MQKKIFFFLAVFLLVSSVSFSKVVSTQVVGPGVTHISMEEDGPLSIQVLKIDLTNPLLEFTMIPGNDDLVSLERPSNISQRIDKPGNFVLGAVNGDFWGGTRTPLGITVQEGDLMVSPYERAAFSISKTKKPLISLFSTKIKLVPDSNPSKEIFVNSLNRYWDDSGYFLYSSGWKETPKRDKPVKDIFLEFEGNPLPPTGSKTVTVAEIKEGTGDIPIPPQNYCLQMWANEPGADTFAVGQKFSLVFETTPEIEGWDTVVGGGPAIIKNGVCCLKDSPEPFRGNFVTDQHPRTGVGYSEDEKTLFLVVVDGRQPGFSIGVSLYELADIMINLGCYQAVNFDGGGSSCMVVRNEVASSPSDGGGERATCNTFCVISTAPQGKLAILKILPENKILGAAIPYQFSIKGFDEFWNPVQIDPNEMKWSTNNEIITVDSKGRVYSEKDGGEGTLFVRVGDIQASAPLKIVPVTDWVVVPDKLLLPPDDTIRLEVSATGFNGEEIYLTDNSYQLEVFSRDGVEVDGSQIKAVKEGQGELLVKLGKQEKKIPYTVAPETVTLIEGFEEEKVWPLSFQAADESIPNLTRSKDVVKEGEYSGRLDYTLLKGKTSAVYCEFNQPLPGAPRLFSLWVYGDGGDHLLRAVLRDPDGEKFLLSLSAGVSWKGEWKKLTGSIENLTPHWGDPGAQWQYPLTLDNIYIVEPREQDKGSGTLYFDQIETLGFPE